MNDKVTVKIDREVYKQLQQIKLDTGAKSVSDVVKVFAYEPILYTQQFKINDNDALLICGDVFTGIDNMGGENLTANIVIDFKENDLLNEFISNVNRSICLGYESAGEMYKLSAKDFYIDFTYSVGSVACIYVFIENYMEKSKKEDQRTFKALMGVYND
jgi:hypothetical protein